MKISTALLISVLFFNLGSCAESVDPDNLFEQARNASGPDEAIKFLEQAADGGHAEATFLLGNIYFQGDIVAKDFEKGASYYETAAKLGHLVAQNRMIDIYKIDRDAVMTFVWAKISVANGATENVSVLKIMEETIEKDGLTSAANHALIELLKEESMAHLISPSFQEDDPAHFDLNRHLLHDAVSDGNKEFVEALLDLGANPHSKIGVINDSVPASQDAAELARTASPPDPEMIDLLK